MPATLAPHNSHENSDPVFGDTRGPCRRRSHRDGFANLQARDDPPSAASLIRSRVSGTNPKPTASPNSGTRPAPGRSHDTKPTRYERHASLQADAAFRLSDTGAADVARG